MTTLTTVPVKDIKLKAGLNARQKFADKDLEPLKLSIERKGILVPLVLQPNGKGYELVAGHRRFRCAQLLKLDEIPATIREAGDELEVTAIENMQRQQLNPVEEARAIEALISAGYTETGAADALSISKKLVTLRRPLLTLPESVQDLVAKGELVVGGPKDEIYDMVRVSPALAETYAKYLLEHGGNRDFFQTAQQAVEEYGIGKEELWPVQIREISPALLKKLGATDEERKQIKSMDRDEWGYKSPWKLTLSNELIAEAVAAGYCYADPSNRSTYWRYGVVAGTEAFVALFRRQLEADVKEHSKRAAKRASSPSSSAANSGDAEKEKRRKEREAAYEASIAGRGLNLELGGKLLTKLASRPFDKDAAELLAALILTEHNGGMSDYAYGGLRLLLEDWQEDQTKTLKSGKRGKVKIAYADRASAEKKAWAWFDQAKTADELLGRLLVVLAAAQYSLAEALPQSQQWEVSNKRPISSYASGRRKKALQALDRIAKPVLTPAYKTFVNAQKRRRSR